MQKHTDQAFNVAGPRLDGSCARREGLKIVVVGKPLSSGGTLRDTPKSRWINAKGARRAGLMAHTYRSPAGLRAHLAEHHLLEPTA